MKLVLSREFFSLQERCLNDVYSTLYTFLHLYLTFLTALVFTLNIIQLFSKIINLLIRTIIWNNLDYWPMINYCCHVQHVYMYVGVNSILCNQSNSGHKLIGFENFRMHIVPVLVP